LNEQFYLFEGFSFIIAQGLSLVFIN